MKSYKYFQSKRLIRGSNLLMLFAAALLWCGGTMAQEAANVKPDTQQKYAEAQYVPDEIIVQFDIEAAAIIEQASQRGMVQTNVAAIDALNSTYKVQAIEQAFKFVNSPRANKQLVEQYGIDRIYVLKVPEGVNIKEAVKAYGNLSMVKYAEPNYIASAHIVPNDPNYPDQWGLNNTGQADPFGGGGPVGTPGADINAEAAWDLHTGTSGVTIAILDTGVDYLHPEFTGRIVPGYDFINNDNDPMDDRGHGTSCAGIAAAAGNNGAGVAGVNWNALIMPVKVLNSGGTGSWTAIANGVTWAADNGAHVLSLSLGGSGGSATLENAVDYAHSLGCIVLASRGNNDNTNLSYPASYANAVAIAALSPCNERKDPTTCDGEDWWGSSYGSDLDVTAPGTRIWTTDIQGAGGYENGDYVPDFNGTSAACPFAAGVAALIMSFEPGITNDQIRNVMNSTAVDIEAAGFDIETGYGRLNAFAALASLNEAPVAQCQDVIVSANADCEAFVTPEQVDDGSYDPNGNEITFSLSPAGPYPLGDTEVTLTVSDAAASSTCTATITVVDNTPPVITCPADIIVSNDPGECSAVVNFSVTATDNCDANVDIVVTPPSGSTFPVGTTTVNATATDDAGNISGCSFDVTVEDTEAPVITVIDEWPYLWPPNHVYESFDVNDFVLSVSDNCSDLGKSDVIIASASSDEPEEDPDYGDGETYNDMVIGMYCQSIDVRKERDGSKNGRVYTIYFELTDEYGNTGEASAQVHVPQHKKSMAIDDGMAYEVFGSCGTKVAPFTAETSRDVDLVAYPNPVKESTTINFYATQNGKASIELYSSLGEKVAVLFDQNIEADRDYTVELSADQLTDGIYFYNLKIGNKVNITNKLIVIK